MYTKKYGFIVINILIILSLIGPLFNLYKMNQNIKDLILTFVLSMAMLNLIIFIVSWTIDRVFQWFEKRTKEKYSLYEWLGNPVNPITLKNKLSTMKEFTPENFKGNCRTVKNEILLELSELDDLNNYKKFLELKNKSPRFNSLLSSSQSIFIATITASILTFLNLTEISYFKLIISYFFLIVSAIALITAIDYMSKAMDRDKILLLLVDECIKEKENEMAQISSNQPLV
ncbi:hypothetical protein [Planococcus shenhongbingii]|uniref:DUF4231 domain-containing protein n=1 Tax=Planococcus shenhongbingii TaxID=3058398 RepID=A0ABT8N9U6_9BACL|nr:hypothetical protein [Planococcus sp. N017]MDN7244660.1 hypothetical protein [Planococcus sp. N017]